VLIGALVTAFVSRENLGSFYISKAILAHFGTAGSLVVLLLWILFIADFIFRRNYYGLCLKFGEPIKPAELQ
jgi:hypothetical protein